jgi:hypothetical protein
VTSTSKIVRRSVRRTTVRHHAPRRFAHAAIREALRRDIWDGRLRAGDQLSTELEMVERFGVSRHTVRAALAHLASEGLITRRAGRGTFATPHPTDPANMHIVSDDQHMFGLAGWPPADVVEPLHLVGDPWSRAVSARRRTRSCGCPFRRTSDGRRVRYGWSPCRWRPARRIEPALAAFEGGSGTIVATVEAATGRIAMRAERTMTAESAATDLAERSRSRPIRRCSVSSAHPLRREGSSAQHVLARFVLALFCYRLNVLRTPRSHDVG